MKRGRLANLFLLLTVSACSNPAVEPARGQQDDSIVTANKHLLAAEYAKAIEISNRLLEGDDVAAPTRELAERIAVTAHHRQGDDFFRAGDMPKCIAAYDAVIELRPELKPQYWQRGIALYYAERYEDGVEQFEVHQTVNSQDVENAVWHMLCAVRAPGGLVEKARANLIPIERDSRVPMAEVHRMFAGELEPDDVSAAARDDGTVQAQFYADLYIGLYHEMVGKPDLSAKHISSAADNPSSQRHFMGDVARVHRSLRPMSADVDE